MIVRIFGLSGKLKARYESAAKLALLIEQAFLPVSPNL